MIFSVFTFSFTSLKLFLNFKPKKMKVLHVDENHPLLIDNLSHAGFKNTKAYSKTLNEVLEMVDQFEGLIIRSRFPINRDFLNRATKLKFIGRVGAGVENIDQKTAQEKGIKLFAAPLGNSNAVGEHTLGLLLSLFNKLHLGNQSIREGNWLREEHRGLELEEKTIGIIGFGTMGKSFAKKLEGFDVKRVVFHDLLSINNTKNASQVSLEELQQSADVLSIHTPQTPLTIGMIDEKFISKMKNNFWLLNTARGSIVKTKALVEGLRNGNILGAGLDVLEYESTSFENIFLTQQDDPDFSCLMNAKNVLLSPHVAGWTIESHRKLAQIIAEKITYSFNPNH
jgi:D-3-phosphoglycerate dehydrogenase|tara:strand:- start:5842 stop:6861 length:1020 start_codon:yes stop_codon:yes gene_type:complete